MNNINLQEISRQLESENLRDRLLALASLRMVEPADAVPLIKKVLYDESVQLRSMAVFALGIKPTSECYEILLNLLTQDPDYGIRADAAGALGYLGDIRAFDHLVRAFYEETSWVVRFSAAVSLGNLKDPRAHAVLLQALNSEEVVIQQAAIAALGEIQDLDALEQMLNFVSAEDWLVRQRLAEALGNLPGEQSIAALEYLAKDAHHQVAEAAQFSLQRLTGNLSQIA